MATYYWVGGNGTWNGTSTTNWSSTSGGTGGAGVPNAADTVIFDANSGTGTCTTAAGSASANITVNSPTLELKLGADHTNANEFTFTLGSIDLVSYTLTTQYITSVNTNARTLKFGTGKVVAAGSSFTVWNFANITNFSYTGTPRVELNAAASSGTRSLNHGFQGGGSEANAVSFYITAGTSNITANGPLYTKTMDFTGFSGVRLNFVQFTYGDLILSPTMTLSAGTGQTELRATSGTQSVTTNGRALDFPLIVDAPGATVSFQDALTMGVTRSLTLTNGTVKLKDGATSTVGSFVTSGANQKFLESTLVGSQATLSQASGTVNASYLSVKDVAATGGAKWNALTACVNQQNNSGWFFSYQQGRPLPAFAF